MNFLSPESRRNYRHALRRLWREKLRQPWLDLRWAILAGVWVFGIALGAHGFSQVPHAANATGWDYLYRSIQLFVLNYSGPPDHPPLELELARWLAPGVASFTALQALAVLFYSEVQLARLRFARNHVVICGLDRKGWLLAKGFQALGERVVCIEPDADNLFVQECRDADITVVIGNATRPDVLKRVRVGLARVVFAVTGHDGTNADIAVNTQLAAAGTERRGALACVVHIVDPFLCSLLNQDALEHQGAGQVRLSYFNVFDNAVDALLEMHDPFAGRHDEASEPPHLLIVGVGRMGEALIAQAARTWWERHRSTGARFWITMIDRHARSRAEYLGLQYRRLHQACHLTALQMEIQSADFLRADCLGGHDGIPRVTSAFVCMDNDSLALSTALFLVQQLADRRIPIMVRMSYGAGLASLFDATGPGGQQLKLYPFGLLDNACMPDMPLTHERLAKAIHADYLQRFTAAGESRATNPSLVPWVELPEELRETSRRMADHIGLKLKAIGCSIGLLNDWDAEHFAFGPAEVELMAVMEHDRFVQERMAAGWRVAVVKDAKRKLSPDLVSWAELDPALQEFNRQTVAGIPQLLKIVGYQVFRLDRSRTV